jgi:putative MATE family efflux protein
MTGSECQATGQQDETAGVSILTGDPKRAILKLSGPMIVAMLLLSIYNLIDAVWVAGLGSDALAAVGFITPFFMILIGIGNGLGAGTSAAIARRIGAEDKTGADNTAMHAIVITIILSALLTAVLLFFAEPLVVMLGAGDAAGLAMEYGTIIFAGAVFVIFTNVAYGILRAEGDTKRTMYAMGGAAVINMILDPILIYGAGLGVAGAALATVIAIAVVSAILLYWFRVKQDTYIILKRSRFRYRRAVVTDILRVGLPASLEFLMMAVLAVILNGLLVSVSGTDAVAIYTGGWRVVLFAIIPVIAIGTSVISVAGAAYGARRYEDLATIHSFSTQAGLAIAVATSLLTWVLAPAIAQLFAYTPESASLAPMIVAFLRTMCLFYPFVPPGIMSASIFQATGKGTTSLIVNILRNLAFIAVFAYVLGIALGFGETGVWWGIVAGNILGGIVAHLWARLYISRIIASRETIPAPAPV